MNSNLCLFIMFLGYYAIEKGRNGLDPFWHIITTTPLENWRAFTVEELEKLAMEYTFVENDLDFE